MSCSGGRRSVSDWGYVTLAFTIVWAALAVYGLLLARRVTQAERAVKALSDAVDGPAGDNTVCDVPPGT